MERREPEISQQGLWEVHMLSWALTFFVVAIIAAVLGFTSIAGAAAGIAKICSLFSWC